MLTMRFLRTTGIMFLISYVPMSSKRPFKLRFHSKGAHHASRSNIITSLPANLVDNNLSNNFASLVKPWNDLHSKPPEILYHSTTAPGVAGILRESRIHATHADFLYDSSEIQYAVSLVRNILAEEKQKYEKELEQKVDERMMASEKEIQENLSWWETIAGWGLGAVEKWARKMPTRETNAWVADRLNVLDTQSDV